MEERLEYAFLELLSESEGTRAGFQLSEKHNFSVYQKIKKLTTPDNAKSESLFSEEHLKNSKDKAALLRAIKNLLSAKLVLQLFYFSYKKIDGENVLKCIPCFLARNTNEPEELPGIFGALVEASARAVEAYIHSLPPLSFREIWAEFERDLRQGLASEDSGPQDSPPKSILNLQRLVRPEQFPFLPDSEAIALCIGNIESLLEEKGSAVPLPGIGLLGLREETLLSRYEAAETFLLEKVVPYYYKIPGIKDALTDIAQEEAIYYLDEEVPRTTVFSEKKARLLFEANEEAGLRGGLAIWTVTGLANEAEYRYRQSWQQKIEAQAQKILEPLFETHTPWQKRILFVSREKLDRIPRAVWDKVRAHPDLIFGEWQTKNESMHIAFRRDRNLAKELVEKLVFLPQWEYWKILAFRQMIEEHDDYFRELFVSQGFKRAYGRLLRLVYVKHVPWYYRIFWSFGLQIFQKQAFALAKQNIQLEQEKRFLKNQERYHKEIRHKEWLRQKRIEKIQSIAKVNHIKNKLDQFYFIRKSIPTMQDVQSSLQNFSQEEFLDCITKNSFQLIKRRGLDSKTAAILCYPLDSEWYAKRKRLEATLYFITETEPDVERTEADEENFRRAITLQKHLAKALKVGKKASSNKDPYLLLEAEIRKQKKRERLLQTEITYDSLSSFEEEELDV